MLSNAAAKDPAMSGQLAYERIEGDFYATPPENVDCLAHFLDLKDRIVWEPACGEGHISKRLARFAKGVYSSDLFNRGFGTPRVNFLARDKLPDKCTAIITNPPYGDDAQLFIEHALKLTQPVEGLVAMFMRNEYDMACTRSHLFEDHPAYMLKVCVTKRPRWIAGSKGSPRHNYAWYVWDWAFAQDPRDGASVRYIHPKDTKPHLKTETEQ